MTAFRKRKSFRNNHTASLSCHVCSTPSHQDTRRSPSNTHQFKGAGGQFGMSSDWRLSIQESNNMRGEACMTDAKQEEVREILHKRRMDPSRKKVQAQRVWKELSASDKVWPLGLVPAVQWAFNAAFRERYAFTPHHVLFGRAPRTSFATLASYSGDEWHIDALGANALKQQVQQIFERRQTFTKRSCQKWKETGLGSVRQQVASRRGIKAGSASPA